jgi:hypothetical protein
MTTNRTPPALHGLQCLPVHVAFALAVVAMLLRDYVVPAAGL